MSMFKKSLVQASCLLFSLGAIANASADIKISGFASVVGGTYSEDTYEYAGYDDEFSFSPDTSLGLQFRADISDKVKVTALLVAKGQDDYDVEAELAYVTYAAKPNWDVRMGRIRVPYFYYSEFIDVGYAYPWIRPPIEVYRVGGDLATFDGIDTLYRTSFGSWDSTFQVFYGRTKSSSGSVNFDLTNRLGFNLILNRDWLTLRAGYTRSDLTGSGIGTEPLFDAITAAGFGEVADRFDLRLKQKPQYFALAAVADYNDWLVNIEYTTIQWNNGALFANDVAWFAMLGRRFGDYTVHLTYAVQEEDPDFDKNTIPVGVDPLLDLLHTSLDGAISNNDDDSITLGVRYDLDAGIALKAEVTRFNAGIAEPLFPGQQGLDNGTLLTFGVDVVF